MNRLMKNNDYLKIIDDYGAFLEKTAKCKYFPIMMPEKILPYSKNDIIDSIKQMEIVYKMDNNIAALEILELGLKQLEYFTNDYDAWKINRAILEKDEYWK